MWGYDAFFLGRAGALGSSSIIWDWYGLENLNQCGKSIKTRSQKVLESNSYVREVTGENLVGGLFIPLF